ncbi:hypothetical protein DWB85_00665 [Seongchinamella sediminis]|uniref:Nucleotidyltransferase-like domain-containing protein n=1 Tax=Seongchinamella sediminis TaxID=2283635 RepID=A0A3L7E515_9GAMM|nr:GSU2403 family nucleotidyltransferase fold protein [Seongchinamella sediminis]RLQ23701.1 hypothetical protein DWB85_00665 [Seongchinamella sediminis]
MGRQYTDLPGSALVAYSDLLDFSLSNEVTDRTGFSFSSKNLKSGRYWYLQHVLGDRRKQYYLGEESDELLARIEQQRSRWLEDKAEKQQMERLVAMCIAAGCSEISHMAFKVLNAAAQSGLFRAGGVLVGSYAFIAIGNMLGVSWNKDTTVTQDVDLAGSGECMIAIPEEMTPLKDTILSSEESLLEVPMLDRKSPSTSFKVRGKEFKVDLITPAKGKGEGSLYVGPIKSYADQVRFLDYLLEDTQKAVLLHKSGVVVNVPNPARYGVHKLVVSQRRPLAKAAKAKKDIQQAAQVLSVLLEHRPGDLWLAIDSAKEYAKKNRSEKFLQQMRAGVKQLPTNLRDACNEQL